MEGARDLSMVEDFQARVHKANVQVHRVEAKYYELIHGEIYSKGEQKRINSALKRIDKLIDSNQKEALDFGAGTGNLTGKLLHLGYRVTALDISAEMCSLLKKKYKRYVDEKKLRVINSPIEDVSFDKGEFDLITCYSVLHHLPNYETVLQKLSAFLRKGGVMYLDHESTFYSDKPNKSERFVRNIYFKFNWLLNTSYGKIKRVPSVDFLDYSLSDYWASGEHHTDHTKIASIFTKENFGFFIRIDYHSTRTWIFNPTFYMYKYFCQPDTTLWIAKK
jgi:ubiquinone/menaquinone biosynthesis C-methylase UbiE